jgi:DNA polymerase-3 subunit gamma/tau
MFDTIAGQAAVARLASDFEAGKLPPSILFSGPSASGKGTAALELARVFSCEGGEAAFSCACPACARHRLLLHPDALCMGARGFSAEIAAAAEAFARSGGEDAELVFTRAVRKLLARFSPTLWEDEPKFSKIAPLVAALEEALDETGAFKADGEDAARKRISTIVKDAIKLEADGVGGVIPINQIRRASAWARLAPSGRRKTLIIENADRMQEGARNSLLKILEEPPENVTIVLTTSRERALLQTILSRVRPYRFARRGADVEAVILRRVFGAADDSARGGITAYLESFLPVSAAALRPLAALFASSAAAMTAAELSAHRAPPPAELVALGKYAADMAEAAGMDRYIRNPRVLIEKILAGAESFEIRGLFSRFLAVLLDIIRESMPDSVSPAFLDLWRSCAVQADTSASSFNQKPAPALNRLLADARRGMTDLWRV